MAERKNLTCVGALLRLEIDVCMRIWAAFIAEDRDTFMNGFINGKSIRDFYDDEHNKMTDVNLRKRMKKLDPQIDVVYKMRLNIFIYQENHLIKLRKLAKISRLNLE